MSQDHHSRLKTISLAPFALKAYVDRYLGKEFPNVIETQASDFFWDTSPEEIVSSIDIKDVDLLCFSIYTWNVAELIETSRIFKRKKKNVIIALGGPEVAPVAQKVMEENPHVDLIPFTPLDGELIVYNIAKALIEERGLNTVPGIVFRSADNSLVKTEPLPEHLDLATVPSPYVTGDIKFEEGKDYIATVETSRGCPYDCGYCFWGKMQGVSFFPLERVYKDIETIYNNERVKEVHFTDSDFFMNRKRSQAILEFILKQNPNVITYFEINARTITEDLARLAGSLKNFQFILSPQTSNSRSLELISRKRDTMDIFLEKVKLIRRVAPDAHITTAIILGLPEDTLADFKKTLDFCMSLEPKKLNVGYPLYLLPGSRFYEERDKMGLRYTPKPIYAVLETPTFPQKDMNEAAILICWVQLFICYFPAVRDFLYLAARQDKRRYVEIIERWKDAIDSKLHLLPKDIDITDTVSASVKKWNEVKRDFFLKGSETEGAYTIYRTIYDLEKDRHAKDMVKTIALGVKVFDYLMSKNIDSFSSIPFEGIASKIGPDSRDIRYVFSTFKK